MPRRFRNTICIVVISVAIGKSIAQDNTKSASDSANSSIASSNSVSPPRSTNVVMGNSATFSVVAGGAPALSYQWYVAPSNGVADTNQSVVQTNRSVALISVQPISAGQSQAVITNGSVASSNSVSQVAYEIEQGRGLFTKHCALCHGPHGEGGRGPTLAQPALPRASDDPSLYRIIAEGIK